MSSASSAVTYTSVYTDSEPGRVFWGADEEIPDGGVPRVIVYGYDGLPMQPVDPPSPDYVPGPEHPSSDPQTEVRRMSIHFAPTGWCRIEEDHVVPYVELNGVPVALVARFGVVSKSTDRIIHWCKNWY
ncbi:hypothetical protein Tco_0462320 [Tanacetum coccineum]